MTRRAYRPKRETLELVRRIEALDGIADVTIHAPHGGPDPRPAYLIVTLEKRRPEYEAARTSFTFAEARAWLALEEAKAGPVHTRMGKPIGPEGAPYGAVHDTNCPACVALGRPWGADPRSDAYWSS